MLVLSLLALFNAFCIFNGLVEAVAETFKTEPHFLPQVLNITYTTEDREQLAPGFIFHTPLGGKWGWGPQMYDSDGNLVFNGNETAGVPRSVDFRVCDYLGENATHLCWHEVGGYPGEGKVERNVVYNQSYEQVAHNYTETGMPSSAPNVHEFNMLPGGKSFLQAVYERKGMDLRPYKGQENGTIVDGCFDEVDVLSGNITFSWCASDHYPLHETYIYFEADGQENFTTPKAGGGRPGDPWDYLHINAIDKNEEGDYLVSARHWDQILKIAGPNNRHGLKPGSGIWRLNGRSNQFKMKTNLNFSRQHDVRYISTGPSETILSIFDNGWEGVSQEQKSSCSAGKIIRVNNETMEAELIQEYPDPSGNFSAAQGSMHTLPNGNVLVYWGNRPEVSEYSADGTLLLHGTFHHGDIENEWGYRGYKYQWTGKPSWPPKILAYSKTCSLGTDSPLVAYVSWNGATEVDSWKFHVAVSSRGPWFSAGTFKKEGFETIALVQPGILARLSPFLPHVSVAALDKSGNTLGSALTKTFVPRDSAGEVCDRNGCLEPGAVFFEYEESSSIAGTCKTSFAISYLLLAMGFAVFELCVLLYSRVSSWTVTEYSGSGNDLEIDRTPYQMISNG